VSRVFAQAIRNPSFSITKFRLVAFDFPSSALRKIMILGAGISDITTELIALIVFGTIMTAIAVPFSGDR